MSTYVDQLVHDVADLLGELETELGEEQFLEWLDKTNETLQTSTASEALVHVKANANQLANVVFRNGNASPAKVSGGCPRVDPKLPRGAGGAVGAKRPVDTRVRQPGALRTRAHVPDRLADVVI